MSVTKNNLQKKFACSFKPNCVSSVSKDEKKFLAPKKYFGELKKEKEKLKKIIAKNSHAKIIEEKNNYLHAIFTTSFFKFVDDVEFFFDDEEKVLHFRSRSRTGYYDFGVNRARMESLLKQFAN